MRMVYLVLLFLVCLLSMLLCDQTNRNIVMSDEMVLSATSSLPTPLLEIRPIRDAQPSEIGYAEISWESLLLLLPSKPRNCGEVSDSTLNRKNFYLVDKPLWLRRQPDEPVGSCPARFRLHMDADRLWPRAVICTECLCEGSRCSRRGAHVCVTVHIHRTVITRSGWRREAIPAGCLCAAKRATISHASRPAITI